MTERVAFRGIFKCARCSKDVELRATASVLATDIIHHWQTECHSLCKTCLETEAACTAAKDDALFAAEKTAIGRATRDIGDGEIIGVRICDDGSLWSDAIHFFDGVTILEVKR